MGRALVSVIVPAYNAARYLERTVWSALKQSHQEIEVVIVDDGSQDGTPQIARRFEAADSRVRLITQSNQGVASARNTAFLASSGQFVAPLDADDLWSETKLEKQLQVYKQGGKGVGLVYTLYRTLDDGDLVVHSSVRQRPDGWVFLQQLNQNFIGNGSSPLLRRDVFLETGGYSTRLRAMGAEGCEDLFMQLHVASRYKFGVVPEYLVGYRRTPTNMSSDVLRMAISRKLVLLSFLGVCAPGTRAALLHALYRNDVNILRFCLKSNHKLAALSNLCEFAWRSPGRLVDLAAEVREILGRKLSNDGNIIGSNKKMAMNLQSFWSYLSADRIDFDASPEFLKLMADFRKLDNGLGPAQGYLLQPAEKGGLAFDGLSRAADRSVLAGSLA